MMSGCPGRGVGGGNFMGGLRGYVAVILELKFKK